VGGAGVGEMVIVIFGNKCGRIFICRRESIESIVAVVVLSDDRMRMAPSANGFEWQESIFRVDNEGISGKILWI